MKIYIAGPMKDCPDKNRPAFDRVEEQLINLGHKVVNPQDIEPRTKNPTYQDYMREDIKQLMLCDAIFLLPRWQTSNGARIEAEIASAVGLESYMIIGEVPNANRDS